MIGIRVSEYEGRSFLRADGGWCHERSFANSALDFEGSGQGAARRKLRIQRSGKAEICLLCVTAADFMKIDKSRSNVALKKFCLKKIIQFNKGKKIFVRVSLMQPFDAFKVISQKNACMYKSVSLNFPPLAWTNYLRLTACLKKVREKFRDEDHDGAAK